MKLKMSPNSLFAVLLRSPWWISMLISGVLLLLSLALLPVTFAAFGVVFALPFGVIGLVTLYRQWHLPSAARVTEVLAQAGAMSWRDFANELAQCYAQQGHAVTRLQGSGADFMLVKAGRSTVVSAKRWKAANHGIEALRELVAAKEAQDADFCSYLSLTPVSDAALRFAKAQGVTLLSGPALARLLLGKP